MGEANNTTVYVKCTRSVSVQRPSVYLRDLCTLHCSDRDIRARLCELEVYCFQEKDTMRHVIGALTLIRRMEEACPGITVDMIGETDVLIEYVKPQKPSRVRGAMRVMLVCLISFIGTAFTIMAYHNDIGIRNLFAEVYGLLMGQQSDGLTELEVCYSLGVAIGILIFFNHAGKDRTWTKDPTPLEVSMRSYEKEVDDSLIEDAKRRGEAE